jgi:LuxR family maltose regulon positive regulatory protein
MFASGSAEAGMAIPLLKTKLYIPAVRPKLVARPRLIERLDEGLCSAKLTLISAPAGFGKTTLLGEWIHCRMRGAGRECPAVSTKARATDHSSVVHARHSVPAFGFSWLSLDAGDNDPTRFWAYVIAALQTVYPDVGQAALSALQASQSRTLPVELLLTGLINEVATKSDPLVLVLDDFHLIDSAQVHEGIVFLIDSLPDQGMHVVLSGRADPPWPLARRRARGEMTELRASDLRFTPQEAAAFLNDVTGLGLSAQDIAALDARTEGWIAGLQLAALSMRGSSDLSAFVSAFSGSHRLILDYLVEEVLDRQSADVQAFLLQTSILERMTASLCDAVMDMQQADKPASRRCAGSQESLEHLEQANLFLVPLDDERRWYRYHHLFAELLRGRLHQNQPDLVPVLHRRASRWYEAQGLIDEAFGHALGSGDVERAADLVERNGLQMVVRSECSTLAKWLEELPEELVRRRPWLCVCHAWVRYYVGPREQVEPRLQDAEQALRDMASAETPALTEVERRYVAGHVAALRAYMALQKEELDRVAELAQRALDLLPTGDYARATSAIALAAQQTFGTLPEVSYARATSAIALAETPRERGDLAASERAYARAREIAEECGNTPMAVSAVAYMAYQQAKQGRLHKAQETNRQALALAIGPDGRELPAAGLPYVKMGDLMREWNELQTATRYLERGIELCLQWGHADALITGYTILARVQLAQGDLGRACDTFRNAEQLQQKTDVDPWAICWIDDCRLRLWLAAGDLSAAASWAEGSGLTTGDALSFVRDLEHVNLARALVARGLHRPDSPYLDEALALLARLSEAAEGAGWISRAIEILVLRSVALLACGDKGMALEALTRALTLAEPEGYVRTFVDEGAPVRELLGKAAACPVAPHGEYVGQLLSAFGAAPEKKARALVSSSDLVEPLTEREVEVLRLMATDLTSPEMAKELVVSVNTVRTHIQHIYQKLAVHSRYEAVSRARELSLL